MKKQTPNEKKLASFKNKLLTNEEQIEIIKEAYALKSDMIYIKEHYIRTKQSDYGIRITPTLPGRIDGHFIERIFKWINWNDYTNTNDIERVLTIYKITCKLMEEFSKINDEKIDEKIKIIIKWSDVVKFYTEEDLRHHIHNFIGSSYLIGIIQAKWDLMVKEDNEDDTGN